jgi:hypothetical protein
VANTGRLMKKLTNIAGQVYSFAPGIWHQSRTTAIDSMQ